MRSLRRPWPAGMALLLVPAMAGLPGAAATAATAAGPAPLRPVAAQKPVPVHVVPSHPVKVAPNRPWHLPRTVWPAAGTARVTLPSPGSARAGSLPVWVGPPSGPPARTGQGQVRVVMASRNAATAAGISGVIFTAAQAGASHAGLRVHVSLDYSSFAYADGGDYASRLHLVELPACALTSPGVPGCRRQTPLASSNDVQAFRLGADITLPAVVAASPATSGSTGDYTATPLSEAGTWSEGGSSGAFTYSYPIQVPPVPGGLEPSVSLGYDSQAVDGLTSSTNNQASWIGDGWDYQPGFIERDYQSCEQNPAGATKTGDLCWSSNNVTTLSLGGVSTTLVDDPSKGWHAEADNGYKITYMTGSGSNGTHDDDYWVVTTPDGVSYYFGRNELPGWASGDTPTDSVFTVPVYAPASTDPCYNATFSQSHCVQAWRWNLDWVTDPHGDAMAYYYDTETNYYAADNGTKATASYTQGGVPSKITYGLRSGNAYGASAAQVTFTSAADRTDVPTGSADDLACSSGATCDVVSPTFWAKFELTTIATSTLEGTTQEPVDSWALSHEYLSTGAGSPAPLWLEQIAHTGEDGGTLPPLPPVIFGGLPLDNRTTTAANLQDGYSMIPRNRITTVTSETGGVTTVTYDTPPSSCTSGTFPAEDANTLPCYPTFWTPPGGSQREDWFNKYVVSDVTQANTVGGTVQVNTAYSYSGAAWHYDDDAVTRSNLRTWDEWRGFARVTAETGNAGDGDPVTETTDTYFQGMNGDYQNGNPVTSASLTSLVGNVTVTDDPQFAGMEFEHTVYDGAGGAIVTDTVTTPWTSAATATQSQQSPLPALNAYMTGTAKTQTFTALASGGYREADVTYAHDSYGRVTSAAAAPDAADNGGGGDPGEDTCTQTSYDGNTTSGLLDLPAEVTVTSVTPANCPVTLPPTQPELVSDTKYYYDNATSITTEPSAGNLTMTQQATSYSGTTEVFSAESENTYDEYGRVLNSLDANAIADSGNPTTTAYTPGTGAEPTSVSVTDPMGLTTTTTYDPARDLPLTVTDPAGLVTTKTYDPLGRLTAVWTPGHTTGGPADQTFSYSVLTKEPSVTTTNTINAEGAYLTSETLYDSLGRQIETQTETPDGNRDITDTYYNSDGWPLIESNSYYTTGAPSPTLVAAPDDQVPSQTGYAYDGTGRVIRQIDYSLATEQWETDTSYGGDYTSVTPPAGGTATTTYVNGLGKTSYVYQYHSPSAPSTPPGPGAGSATGPTGYDQTAYTYYPSGQPHTITDAAGNTWTYGYDYQGDQTSASDPDSGTTSSTYDLNGNLLSVTNSGLKTATSYTYDADNRKTAEYDTSGNVPESASDEVASWTWDTLDPGKLTSSVEYAGGTSGTKYTQSVTGYNALGLPQGTNTQISAGPWSGSYRELFGYTAYANMEANITYPSAGGLPTEEVSIGYNAADQPISLGSSLGDYVAAETYTELGQPQEYALGTTTEPAWILDSYYQATNRLETSEVQTGVSPITIDATTYGYDDAGLITSEADVPASGPTQVQCFTYDYLGRLVQAWSQGSAGCPAVPSQSAESGAAPYWNTYAYDVTDNMTSVTSTPETGTATVTDATFPAPGSTAAGSPQPSPPHGVSGTGPQGSNPTTTYTYDAGGHVTQIAAPGNTQTLNWNDQGQLASVSSTGGPDPGTTSYAYDANGNLLLQQDTGVGTATLYLPGEQLTETTSGSSPTYTSTRYYTIGGVTIAARTSAGTVSYLAGDQQGTATIAIDNASLNATYRYYDPYGNPIGAAPSSWPGTKSFVGGTADPATGLENLGAREYNSGTGSFVSPDPLLDLYDPQDLNAYAYASDDPSSDADPSGASQYGPGAPPNPCGDDAAPSCNPNGAGGVNGGATNDGSGNDGSTYVPITPHFIVDTNDPHYAEMVRAYQRYLSFYDITAPKTITEETALWYEICVTGGGIAQPGAACPTGLTQELNTLNQNEGVADGHDDTSITSGTLFVVGGAFASIGGAAQLTPLPRYYRGAAPGEEPNFQLKPNEYRLTGTGQVRGLSLFNNPDALQKRGFVPYEVNQGTLPPELVIEQRGGNADHFEIVPANNEFLPEQEFQMLLNQIEVYDGGETGGSGDGGGGGE